MNNEPRRIPYGTMNWELIVRECHFVDNTAYIRALENVRTPVFLRPKRFGKTMVCSMLAHYYDVNLKRRFKELFGKTEIGKNPTKERNSYLVLPFDFSTVQVGTLEEIERNFWENVKGAVGCFAVKYAALADWSRIRSATGPADCITKVREVIHENRLPPLYVIIDEYDNFTNELVVSNRDAEYDAVCGHDGATGAVRESFFKTFFKSFKAGLSDGTVGRTYFTGVLPITLDDLSSGFNVGTVVNLNPELLSMVGFTQAQVEKYVDDIYADYGFDPSNRAAVLADLKAFYDGYHFLPGAEPLYNSTICNWYLFNLVSCKGKQPQLVIDANVRTDIGWFRRLAQTNAKALSKVKGYVERGEGEVADLEALSAKFGRTKFFSDAFYPYALYYLGLLTFESRFRMNVPNLTIKNMFVDYYDELSNVRNVDAARTAFIGAAEALCLKDGTWKNLFDAFWHHYVKARIPAQAFDKMNENFFRTTFTSRCLDAMTTFYSFETEYNTPEGRCDFLATPKPGLGKPALLIEFKYFTAADLRRRKVEVGGRGRQGSDRSGRAASMRPPRPRPDLETKRQALAYRDALVAKPGWGDVPVEVVVVHINSSRGYDWLPVGGR